MEPIRKIKAGSESNMSLALPTVTPRRLRKIDRLGGGTYGRVYQAVTETNPIAPGTLTLVVDPHTGQATINSIGHLVPIKSETVAVKRNFISSIFKETVGSLRELDMMNTIKNHSYCIQLKEASFGTPFVDGSLSPIPFDKKNIVTDKVYFIMEKGNFDSETYIRNHMNSPVNDRKMFAVQLFLAIEFLHSRGIYHRDLKPANIICFLDEQGRLSSAKLSDFGLAQYFCKQSMSISGFVTLWYRAPEISLMKDYDYKVDVWSLGCILFELFSTGQRKFMQPGSDEQLINILLEQLPFPKEDYILAQQHYPKKINRSYEHAQKNVKPIEQLLGYVESQVSQFNSSQLAGKPNYGTFAEFVDILNHILVIDPNQRYTVSQCLNHPFFNGYRELIDRTRTLFGISSEGSWILQPDPILKFLDTPIRATGMKWFQIIYANRLRLPTSNWYSHRILFHAIEMYDRYICLMGSEMRSDIHESEIVVWVNTFLFMSAKYFRIMITEFGLEFFQIGVIPSDYPIFKQRVEEFEERVLKDVFKCVVYQPTLFDTAPEFLTESTIVHILKQLIKGELSSGKSMKTIWANQSELLYEVNKIPTPAVSPSTVAVSMTN